MKTQKQRQLFKQEGVAEFSMKKLLAIIVLGLLWSGNAYAECISGDCKNGKGTFKEADGYIYVGQFKYGLYNGEGIYQSRNFEIIYVGDYIGGKRNGRGTYIFPNKNKYVGEWKDDERSGQGDYTFSDGKRRYVGQWRNDKYNGQGTFTFSDGIIASGRWKDGINQGQHTFTYPNGEKKVLEFKDGKLVK